MICREPPPEITGERFDWVVSNPPYRKAGDGPVSEKNPILARARFEITCTLEEVVAAAARLLREGGQAALIHLPERLTDLFYLFREYRLEPKRLCLVYPRPGMPPHRVLLEGRKRRPRRAEGTETPFSSIPTPRKQGRNSPGKCWRFTAPVVFRRKKTAGDPVPKGNPLP